MKLWQNKNNSFYLFWYNDNIYSARSREKLVSKEAHLASLFIVFQNIFHIITRLSPKKFVNSLHILALRILFLA